MGYPVSIMYPATTVESQQNEVDTRKVARWLKVTLDVVCYAFAWKVAVLGIGLGIAIILGSLAIPFIYHAEWIQVVENYPGNLFGICIATAGLWLIGGWIVRSSLAAAEFLHEAFPFWSL